MPLASVALAATPEWAACMYVNHKRCSELAARGQLSTLPSAGVVISQSPHILHFHLIPAPILLCQMS